MNEKQLRFPLTKLCATLFAAGLLFTSSTVSAQVKIGTNPTVIGANSNLEVEASTAGRKMIVDKTTGQVTIADGTQGEGKVFTSDPNGGGRWIAPGVQDSPVLLSVNKAGSPSQTIPANSAGVKVNFGTKVFDKNNNFDLTSDIFTVPVNGTGYYQINGYLHSTIQTTPLGAYIHIFVNGVRRRVLCGGNTTGNAGGGSTGGQAGVIAGGSALVMLNAGEQVDFRIDATSANVIVDAVDVEVYLVSK